MYSGVRSYTSWWLFTTIWICSHSIACCVSFLLLPVLWTIFKSASSVIFSLSALAASHSTNWCQYSCCVPASDALDEAPVDQLALDLLLQCWGVSVAMIHWCEIGTEADNEKKWEVLRIIQSASGQNGTSNSQLACSTHDESCCIWLQDAGVSHHSAVCSK